MLHGQRSCRGSRLVFPPHLSRNEAFFLKKKGLFFLLKSLWWGCCPSLLPPHLFGLALRQVNVWLQLEGGVSASFGAESTLGWAWGGAPRESSQYLQLWDVPSCPVHPSLSSQSVPGDFSNILGVFRACQVLTTPSASLREWRSRGWNL